MATTTRRIPPPKLLLDPNNYRFFDMPDYARVAEGRYHEPKVQDRAFELLKSEAEDLGVLRRSILANGYVPIEVLVVTPYALQKGAYVVVEGNRRLAAAKWILRDHDAGVSVGDSVLATLRRLPCIITPEDEDERSTLIATLMGIRHVSGVKAWGAYQQALLVVELRDEHSMDPADAASKIGLKVREGNRRYNALKALQQMQRDEEFGELARPELYRMFHEAVALPALRSWLGWNDQECAFANDERRELFYEWLVGREGEEEEEVPPKLRTYSDVRQLKKVMASEEATRKLTEPDSSLVEALAIVESEDEADWESKVRAATRALEHIAVPELKGLEAAQVALIEKLRKTAAEQLANRSALAACATPEE